MKTMMMVCLVLLLGCAEAKPDSSYLTPKERISKAYSSVTFQDGISADEAVLLANAYFAAYISGCGGASQAIDKEDTWQVETKFGYAAKPYDPIFVNKKTGDIMCKKGPKVTPKNIPEKNTIRQHFKQKYGYVPDAETAIKIAVDVWEPAYGKEHIAQEKPYRAQLTNGVWIVEGSLPKGWIGGVAIAEIAKDDGEILRVSHGK